MCRKLIYLVLSYSLPVLAVVDRDLLQDQSFDMLNLHYLITALAFTAL